MRRQRDVTSVVRVLVGPLLESKKHVYQQPEDGDAPQHGVANDVVYEVSEPMTHLVSSIVGERVDELASFRVHGNVAGIWVASGAVVLISSRSVFRSLIREIGYHHVTRTAMKGFHCGG